MAGAPASLVDHQDDYDLMEQQLSLSRLPLMKATYAVVVGVDDAPTLKERVSQVRGLFAGGLFKAYAPAGVQRQLIAATCPGMPWPTAVTSKNVSQLGMPDSVAASAPFCGIDLGDPHGILLGTTATGLREPVFFDPAWGPPAPRPPRARSWWSARPARARASPPRPCSPGPWPPATRSSSSTAP